MVVNLVSGIFKSIKIKNSLEVSTRVRHLNRALAHTPMHPRNQQRLRFLRI